jgi:hypothetical protein
LDFEALCIDERVLDLFKCLSLLEAERAMYNNAHRGEATQKTEQETNTSRRFVPSALRLRRAMITEMIDDQSEYVYIKWVVWRRNTPVTHSE